MQTIHPFIESVLPFCSILFFCLGFSLVIVGWTLAVIMLYDRILRKWTPRGWYHSAVLLISDLARGVKGVRWETFHAAKVVTLLTGLREQNPELYFAVLRQLPGINAVASQPKPEKRQGRN